MICTSISWNILFQVNVSPFTEFVNDNPQCIHGFKSNKSVVGSGPRPARPVGAERGLYLSGDLHPASSPPANYLTHLEV